MMLIREEILKEHSKEQAMKIANYACTSQKHFKELMKCFMSNEYRVAQRAAWSVSWAARKQPEMIKPYIKDLVSQMQRSDIHPAVVRNSVRILEQIEIPKQLHGEVMNTCFGFIENPASPIAVKAFSLTTLYNLTRFYPEIKQELKLIIEERWDTETAAFRARGKRILKEMEKR